MTFAESLKRYKFYLLGMLLLMVWAYSSVVPDMVRQWYSDDNYSHAFFVPLIAGYFLYERRKQLSEAMISPWNPGLVVVLLALFQLVLGVLAAEYFTMRSSLIVLLAGTALYLFGREVFRHIRLPLGYLFLMVPIPYILYNAVAFPLRLFVTRVSVEALKLIGIAVVREGNIIMFPSITLEVADACSGMRSLVSLIALAVAYAFYVKTSRSGRWIIIASAVPAAIVTNAMRVIMTGVLAQRWGAKVAAGFFHEFAGLFVFVVAILLLFGVGALVVREDKGA